MLKQDLILQIINLKDHYLKEKIINDHDENEKAKSTENVASNENLNLKITNIV